ncbi:MAG: DNA alkylation repair protein [Bacillota bacterium]
MEIDDILQRLEFLSNPAAVEGMARFGITPAKTYGVSMPDLRKMAKDIGRDHGLARELWARNIRETRILAGLVDDPRLVDERQMDDWASEFDYWEICDQSCLNLFKKTRFAYRKAVEWSGSEKEFVKRAGFVLMACLAVADKKAGDGPFEEFLALVKREASDGRNNVKKAVNWALRQIGKRNLNLNAKAIEVAGEIQKTGCKSAKRVASDALRELTGEAVRKRMQGKSSTTKRKNEDP